MRRLAGRRERAGGLRTGMLPALLCLFLFVALLLFLPWFSALDGAVAGAFLATRTCMLQEFLEETSHLGYGLSALFLLAIALWCVPRPKNRLLGRDLRTVLATMGIGALLVQFLKTLIVRERPSMIPGMAIGHSMPSGDITNGTIALALALWLARRHLGGLGRKLAAAASVPLLLVLVFLRLAPLRHWFTDAAASVLLALACVSFARGALAGRGWWRPLSLGAALGLALLLVTYTPSLRIRLTSPLTLPGKPAAVWQAAAGQRNQLEGRWAGAMLPGRLPSFALEEGEGALSFTVARDGPYLLQFGMLPVLDGSDFDCAELEVTVNRRRATSFVASGGWRQYQIELPRGLIRAGANRIGFRLLPHRGATQLRLSYLLIYPG